MYVADINRQVTMGRKAYGLYITKNLVKVIILNNPKCSSFGSSHLAVLSLVYDFGLFTLAARCDVRQLIPSNLW